MGATAALGVSVLRRYRSEIGAAHRRVVAGSRVIETAAGPIEYADVGTGPPVLMIHGAGGGWDQGLLAFRQNVGDMNHRVIAPSRFGYLRTPVPRDGSPGAQAQAYAALLDKLGLERVAVIGLSAGGLSAMQFAIRYPERTSALVLAVPDSWAPNQGERLIHPAAEYTASNRFIMNVVLKNDFVTWAFMKVRPRQLMTFLGVPKEIQPRLTEEQRASAMRVAEEILPLSRRQDGIMNDSVNGKAIERYALERIQAPTLVVDAADMGTIAGSRYTAEHIPHATLLELETGGHLLLGHEHEVRSAITGFLKKHAAVTAEAPEEETRV